MKKFRHLCKLNQSGVVHYALGALVFILIIGGIGTYVIFNSNAATPTTAETGIITGIGSKCLDDWHSAKINYARVDLFHCDGSNAQKWTINANGTITNSNGECLDVYHSGLVIYTKVDLLSCNGDVAQQWIVNTTNKTIINPHSGMCLDDYRSIIANGNQVDILKCNGSNAQKWTTPMASDANSGGGTTGSGGGGSVGSTGSSTEDIISTLYAYPTLSSWQQVENGAPAVKYAIVNICAPDGTGSGCGSPADEINSDWAPTIAALKAKGITPLYYISTNYSALPLATVESELANAKKWYGIADPMFDTTSANNPSYYEALYNYAVNKLDAGTVMYNPGTVVPQSYMFGTKEIVQVYEGTAAGFETTAFPTWMSSYKANQFSVTLSAGSADIVGADVNDAVKDNIGHFYEDDEAESPNYSMLPSFWTSELMDINNAN